MATAQSRLGEAEPGVEGIHIGQQWQSRVACQSPCERGSICSGIKAIITAAQQNVTVQRSEEERCLSEQSVGSSPIAGGRTQNAQKSIYTDCHSLRDKEASAVGSSDGDRSLLNIVGTDQLTQYIQGNVSHIFHYK